MKYIYIIDDLENKYPPILSIALEKNNKEKAVEKLLLERRHRW